MDSSTSSDASAEPSGNPERPGEAIGGADKPMMASMPPSAASNCTPARSAEPVPARTEVVSQAAAVEQPMDEPRFTRDLFNKFGKHCGACHVEGSSGNFHIENLMQFPAKIMERQDKIRERVTSDDPALFMPPVAGGGKPWSERDQGDPVRELLDLLNHWLEQGAPTEVFYIPAEQTMSMMSNGNENPYLLNKDLAAGLTNIGNCMPSKGIVGEAGDRMSQLDSMFEAATELPERLDQTDLTSFDSEKLAREGVISFAPGYPLFSDNARKMRHVRMPRGKSAKFDPQTQEFEIPANTRFYKTFLKRVIDKQGQERYRKIETRLIVSRPDGPDAEDGSHQVNALFGTYAWNDQETEAKLVTDPLRNGKPFADRLITYLTDEGRAQAVLDMQPLRPLVALREAGVTRTYAIPGSQRCIQCHLGSHNHSFILGFTPLQIWRRPLGQGGVIEDSGADELAQLQRMLDYKVIEGIENPEDLLALEQSQGDRKPRNEYELRAQGYMLGNCSHCHNPRGYATVQNPQLRDILRFFPDKDGGVFQFPLDRVSPRIKRGRRQDVSMPYITPSLYDREIPVLDPTQLTQHKQYLPTNAQKEVHYQGAPWRSLIYRNVDNPFTYAEDFALLPHMPMNVPGYDCRVPRLMGDWMVSIPARKADPALNERWDVDYAVNPSSEEPGNNPQPYVEVKPADPNYQTALAEAKHRLDLYHKGGVDTNLFNTSDAKAERTILHPRYDEYCPDTSDIVDPTVGIASESDTARLTPDDASRLPSYIAAGIDLSDDMNLQRLAETADGVPDRPHWVETDITDPPGDYAPRRSDWSDILVKQDPKTVPEDPRQQTVIKLVQDIKADDGFRDFAVKPAPFGLWMQKPSCNFNGVPKVKDFAGDARPRWLNNIANAALTDTAKAAVEQQPVYMQSPGGMVFSEICINCHGPRFDSRGRQADTLMLMTGGASRVANLREGLLGPSTDPGANRMRVFGAFQNDKSTGQDWTGRYVAWMGLGGTRRVIPTAILSVVNTSLVLGERRPGALAVTDANMLTMAQTLCGHTLGHTSMQSNVAFDVDRGDIIHERDGTDGTSLIGTNGDLETWRRVCSFRNAPPVRIVEVVNPWSQASSGRRYWVGNLGWYRQSSYPATASIGDERGQLRTGIDAANLAPWCVVPPADDYERSVADDYVKNEHGGRPLPFCPQWWLDDAAQAYRLTDKEIEEWTLHGAINAGVSVFLTLDQRLRDELAGKKAQPNYDRCEELAP